MSRHTRVRPSRAVAIGILAALAVVGSACLPVAPAAGRGSPVRHAVVIGDSLVHGMFGTSPRIHEKLVQLLADRGVGVTIAGFPGESPSWSWPGRPSWLEQMRHFVAARDPDVVIIQSTVMGLDWRDAAVQTAYRQKMAELMDVARSRGAHVYVVANPEPPADRHDEWRLLEQIQAELASSRGIATIPLIEWMPVCEGAVIPDGWHFTTKGQDCQALAYTAAVDQLRARFG